MLEKNQVKVIDKISLTDFMSFSLQLSSKEGAIGKLVHQVSKVTERKEQFKRERNSFPPFPNEIQANYFFLVAVLPYNPDFV